jgi:hypothetical protein
MDRNNEARSRRPLQVHRGDLLLILAKFATSLLMVKSEQPFGRDIENGASSAEKIFIPEALWGMFLIAKMVARECLVVTQVLAKGCFCRNVSNCGLKVEGDCPERERFLQDKSPLLNLSSQILICESR